jgi:membrane protease YdiL (CAAX protease family)
MSMPDAEPVAPSTPAPRTLPWGLVALWPVVELVSVLAGLAVVEVAGGSRHNFGDVLGAQELGLLFGLPVLALLFLRRAERDGQTVPFPVNGRVLLIGAAAGAGLLIADGTANQLDRLLFGVTSAPHGHIPPWSAVLLLVTNGVVGPVCEELAWRGVLQPRMIVRFGTVPGLVLTAVLFSLKHCVVDFSFGRLFAIIAFGLVAGAVRIRWGTSTSAAAHVTANLVGSIFLLAS